MISLWLTTFLLNAVWQITTITLLAFLCAKLLRRLPSRHAHRAWATALVACVLIPLATVLIEYRTVSRMDPSKGVEFSRQ